MPDKKYTWHKIAESENELLTGENGIAVVEVKGKKICVTKSQGEWYAFAYKCPHASGMLSEGYIDSHSNVVCPVHRYRFSLKNGRNTSGEGFYLRTYPAELRTEGLYIGLPDSGLFSWI